MPLPNEPLRSICPILIHRTDPSHPAFSFLGTGFFVDDRGLILTAKHVFADNPLGPGESYMFMKPNFEPLPISDIRLSRRFDIGSGRATDYRDYSPLHIATRQVPTNTDVVTVEYSQTRTRIDGSGRATLTFQPFFRKGHVHTYYFDDALTGVQAEYLDLSFPALKGASGAPVITEDEGMVVGMVVANVERELLPAQVLTVMGRENTETTTYFLPIGLALSWVHLREFVAQQ